MSIKKKKKKKKMVENLTSVSSPFKIHFLMSRFVCASSWLISGDMQISFSPDYGEIQTI